MSKIKEETIQIIEDVISQSGLKAGDCLVVGCSSSEVNGDRMGTNSNVETAHTIFDAVYEITQAKGIYLAAQCCEHLNRAVVVEAAYTQRERLDEVNVRPQPKAGGSFATCAYEAFEQPAVLEAIRADAGIDIGGVLIGMHIKAVAVPLKLQCRRLGDAVVIAARSRPKFIGGQRAHYDENKL